MPRRPLIATLALPLTIAAQAAPAPPAIPFALDGHLFIEAMINGQPALLLLDPVDGLVLDRRFVQQRPDWNRDWRSLGMAAPTLVGGAGGAQVEVTFADSVALDIGAIRARFARLPVIPLDSMMGDAISRPVAGLLGTTVLANYAVEFDFRRKLLILHDPATIDTTGWQVLPLRMIGARAVTEVTLTIADTVHYPMNAVVDLGMSPGFRVSTREVDRRGLMRHAGRLHELGRGLGGSLFSANVENATIQLGGLTTRPMTIALARESRGADADPPYDALLGLAVLSQFDVIYDPGNGRMLVRLSP